MKKLSALLITVVVALMLSLPAFAGSCPRMVKQVDEKVASMNLDAATLAKVKALRDKGEKLHKAGQHTQSVAVLNEALEMLK